MNAYMFAGITFLVIFVITLVYALVNYKKQDKVDTIIGAIIQTFCIWFMLGFVLLLICTVYPVHNETEIKRYDVVREQLDRGRVTVVYLDDDNELEIERVENIKETKESKSYLALVENKIWIFKINKYVYYMTLE